MNWHIISEHNGQQVCWSKKTKSVRPRNEAALDPWEHVWSNRAAALAYARRHKIPAGCVDSNTWRAARAKMP
jgi:hypothetical protein